MVLTKIKDESETEPVFINENNVTHTSRNTGDLGGTWVHLVGENKILVKENEQEIDSKMKK